MNPVPEKTKFLSFKIPILRRELTSVHHILLGGGVVIVEGLAGLDRIESDTVEFVALPLNYTRR